MAVALKDCREKRGVGSNDIVAPDEFQKYPPLVMALLPKYGGVVLASDTAGFLLSR
jgi:hypothetical protein